VFKKGYIEELGHVMWFSQKFWQKVGRGLADIEASGRFVSITKIDSVDRVQFQNKPFTSASGEEGLFQNRLRSMLFP